MSTSDKNFRFVGLFPADINKPLREAAEEKVAQYQGAYANDHTISFTPGISSTSGRIDVDFRRLLLTTLTGRAQSSSGLQVS